MTVIELKNMLDTMPDDARVVVQGRNGGWVLCAVTLLTSGPRVVIHPQDVPAVYMKQMGDLTTEQRAKEAFAAALAEADVDIVEG